MTTRADYTDVEWAYIAAAIPNATAAVMLADYESADEVGKEAVVASQSLQATTYHKNELVTACVDWLGSEWNMAEAKQNINDIVLLIQHALVVLDAKAPADEVAGFKRFLFDVCNRVAQAYAEKSGKPVSQAEAAVLNKIHQALWQTSV